MNGFTRPARARVGMSIAVAALATAGVGATADLARPDDAAGAARAAATAAAAWEALDDAPQGLYESQGAAVGGRLYVLGGYVEGLVGGRIRGTTRSWVLDPAAGPKGTWSELPWPMPQQLTHTGVAVRGPHIFLVGGFVGDHPGPPVADVWRFDTTATDAASAWTRMPSLPAPRGSGGAAVVGSVLHAFGGVSRRYVDEGEHWTLDLDAPGATWQPAPPMPAGRERNHLAAGAVGGRVYAVGGQRSGDERTGNLDFVDEFDPATGRWTARAPLPAPRGHVATALPVVAGRLLAVGGTENTVPGDGRNGIASGLVTAYDPAADAWAPLPGLPQGRKTPVAGHIGARLVSATGGAGPTKQTWALDLPGTGAPRGPVAAPRPAPAPAPPATPSPSPGSASGPARPAPVGGTGGAADAARGVVRLTGRTLRLSRRTVTVRLACGATTAGTTGRVTLVARGLRSTRRPIATRRFRCAGSTATVRLTLPAAQRRQVRQARSLRLTAVVTVRARGATRTTRTAVAVRR